MGRLEPLPMFLAENPGLRRGGRVPSSQSRSPPTGPHPPPLPPHSLFDAANGVRLPQALVMASSPRHAVIFQSLPVLVEVFLL